MKITKISLFGAVIVGALLACATMAQAQDAKEGKGGGKRGMPTVQERLDQLDENLKLTDEQKPKVKAVLEDQSEKMKALRDVPQDERREKGRALREEMGTKLKAILTPEQYTKYEAMPRGGRGKKGGEGDAKKN